MEKQNKRAKVHLGVHFNVIGLTVFFLLFLTGEMALSNNQKWELTQRVWNSLSKNNLGVLDEYYDENVKFVDPLGSRSGLNDLRSYYAELYKNAQEVSFEFTDKMISEEQQYFSWRMRLKAKGLNSGEPFFVDGASQIKFSPESDKVIYHRDYFDTGEFIYENVTGLKWIHKLVKKSLNH